MMKILCVGCFITIACLGLFVFLFHERSGRPLAKENFIKIPIRYLSILKEPHIEVEIEKNKFYFKIDSGSDTQFSLQSKLMQKIQSKNFIGKSIHYNFKGIKHISEIHEIEKIKIGEILVFHKTKICSDHDEAVRKANKLNEESNISSWIWGKLDSWMSHGKIGNGILKNFVCYFDFPSNTFCIAKDLENLVKQEEYSLDQFISAPIEVAEFGPILKVETKWGTKAFLLDTGSTRSLINLENAPNKEESKSDLFLENFQFGNCCFVIRNISPLFTGIDGILGMDFFQQNVVCLDYPQKTVYISPQKRNLDRKSKSSGFFARSQNSHESKKS